MLIRLHVFFFFFFQAEDGIRDVAVTGVQTCALPISSEMFSIAFRTSLARAMVSFGSVPFTAGLTLEEDLCSPTYPSEASFCAPLDDNPAVSAWLPLPPKWLSKSPRWEARVATIALEVSVR